MVPDSQTPPITGAFSPDGRQDVGVKQGVCVSGSQTPTAVTPTARMMMDGLSLGGGVGEWPGIRVRVGVRDAHRGDAHRAHDDGRAESRRCGWLG